MIQAVLPDMLHRGSGQIINISSVVGYQPIPRMTVYSATKAALNALTTEPYKAGAMAYILPNGVITGFAAERP